MANWTNIPTDRIEPGKPIRAIDGLALRDNPVAIAEGAAGAPKVQEEAMSVNSINGDRLRTDSTHGNRLINRSVDQSKLAEDNGTRDWVGRRIAAMGAGAVGTYAFVTRGLLGTSSWGQTVAGSSLRAASVSDDSLTTGSALTGTWRIMGNRANHSSTGNTYDATLALRIS